VIIPLDKLIMYNENRYIFTRATMKAVDNIDNIEGYPEPNPNWKVVPNVLKLVLDDTVKVEYKEEDEIEE
jgi:hypothetical protein